MKWIKATDKLPENPGQDNSVIIRGNISDLTGYEETFAGMLGEFVTTGFRNFNEKDPKMYFIMTWNGSMKHQQHPKNFKMK